MPGAAWLCEAAAWSLSAMARGEWRGESWKSREEKRTVRCES
jgi:hypothetical protein